MARRCAAFACARVRRGGEGPAATDVLDCACAGLGPVRADRLLPRVHWHRPSVRARPPPAACAYVWVCVRLCFVCVVCARARVLVSVCVNACARVCERACVYCVHTCVPAHFHAAVSLDLTAHTRSSASRTRLTCASSTRARRGSGGPRACRGRARARVCVCVCVCVRVVVVE